MSDQTQQQKYTEKELEEKPFLLSPFLLHDLSYGQPKSLRFSPNDKFLAVAADVSQTSNCVLDVQNNFELIATFPSSSHSMVLPLPLDFSDDGTRLLMSAPNKKMQVISCSTWKPVYSEDICLDHQQDKAQAACCAQFRPSCSKKHEFAVGDTNRNKNVRIVGDLDTDKPKVIHVVDVHTNWALCVRYSSSGSTLFSGSVDTTIVASDADNSYVKLREVVTLPGWVCNFSEIFADGERIACGSWHAKHFIVNLREGKIVSEHEANSGSTYDIAITHSKSTRREPFVYSGCSGKLAFSTSGGEKAAESIDMGGSCYSTTLSHNNKLLAVGSTCNSVAVFKQPLKVFVAEDRMPAFKLRMLSKGKISEACEIYNVTVLIALYLA